MFHSLNLSDPHTLLYIKTIGYPTLLLLMILEGPIITILGAFLSSLGFFNVFVILFLSISGDIIGDIILYAIGYHGGAKILEKAQNLLKIKSLTLDKLKRYFEKHGKKTIFYVKSTTGLCWITFILAGTIKMSFRDFIFASFWGGIVWSSFLVVSGYFFGYAFERINEYIKISGIIIAVSIISFYVLLLLYKRYQTAKLLKNNNNTN
jgi:membrane protein DedA with SNARE-associated domain